MSINQSNSFLRGVVNQEHGMNPYLTPHKRFSDDSTDCTMTEAEENSPSHLTGLMVQHEPER